MNLVLHTGPISSGRFDPLSLNPYLFFDASASGGVLKTGGTQAAAKQLSELTQSEFQSLLPTETSLI